MSRMICLADPKVKPTHRTPNTPHRFGAGILASRPFAGVMPYTQADLDEAAQMLATSAEDRQHDELAAQRAWEDAYEAGLIAPAGVRPLPGLLAPHG